MRRVFEEGLNAYENKAYPQAYQHFEEAAKLNNTDAMINLAIMHLKGYGCSKDIGSAVEWYKEAAALGSSRAMATLAHIHEKGLDGTPDMKKALEYYILAANEGVVDAQYKAGMLLREAGEIAQSMQYFITAAHNNHAYAQEIVTYVSNAGVGHTKNSLFRSLDVDSQKALIEKMIQTKITPMLESDNGGIKLINYISGDIPQVWLNYLGACSGCHLGSTSTADMVLKEFESLIDKNIVLYLM